MQSMKDIEVSMKKKSHKAVATRVAPCQKTGNHKLVRASSNSPSVLTIFRFAAYLNQVQAPIVLFGLAPCGTDFSFRFWKSQVLPSRYAPDRIFFYSVACHL